MPHLDINKKQLVFKIVYYGPGMSGKTTNLLFIHKKIFDKYKGDMIILDTEEERTLFFDFFPVSLGSIQGFSLKIHLYTIPGQVYYEASRKIILEGADAIVFVADSNPAKLDDNIEMYKRMLSNLESFGVDIQTFPIVLQYNKRDFSELIPIGQIEEILNIPSTVKTIESVAINGKGVMKTLQLISKEMINNFQLNGTN